MFFEKKIDQNTNLNKPTQALEKNRLWYTNALDKRLDSAESIMSRNPLKKDTQEKTFSGDVSLRELVAFGPGKYLEKINSSKQAAQNAKDEFLEANTTAKEKINLQKKYINAQMDYAKAVLGCKLAVDKDYYDAIVELRDAITKCNTPEFKDETEKAVEILEQLNKGFEPYNKLRRKEIMEQVKDVYDEDMAKKIAEESKKSAGDKTSSTSLCAMYVRKSLENAGVVEKDETKVVSAYMLKDKYLKTNSFAKIEVSSVRDLDALPAGCIIVWQPGKGFGDAFAEHGHVAVTQGEGKVTSDYNQYLKDYGTDFSVYVPKKVSTKERIQYAKESREDFLKIPNRRVANNIIRKQYLYDYTKAAKSVLTKGGASTQEIEELISLMSEVPRRAAVPQEQAVISEIRTLVPKLKSLVT